MAEEKKITDEILSDEELEQVAGGDIYQMEDDSKNFKKLGVLSQFVNDHDKIALKAAFAAYGITTEQHGGYLGEDNKYFLGNQKISRETAWQIVNTKWAQGNRPRVL
jgi:hypothetical protein